MNIIKVSILTLSMLVCAYAVGNYGNDGGNNYGSRSNSYNAVGSGSYSSGSVNYVGNSGFNSGGRGGQISGASTGNSYGGGSSSFSGGASGYNQNQNVAPEPYKFDYQVSDEEGNTHYRTEEGDASGTVRGTYGYTDVQGVYRVVEYVADANGFRANIQTNEPGTDGKESPADVTITANEPPAGLQDRFSGNNVDARSRTGGFNSGNSNVRSVASSGFGGGSSNAYGGFDSTARGSGYSGGNDGSNSYNNVGNSRGRAGGRSDNSGY